MTYTPNITRLDADREVPCTLIETAELARLRAINADLLTALEHVRETLRVRADYWANDSDEYEDLLGALDQSTAAIAKATRTSTPDPKPGPR